MNPSYSGSTFLIFYLSAFCIPYYPFLSLGFPKIVSFITPQLSYGYIFLYHQSFSAPNLETPFEHILHHLHMEHPFYTIRTLTHPPTSSLVTLQLPMVYYHFRICDTYRDHYHRLIFSNSNHNYHKIYDHPLLPHPYSYRF